MDASQPWALGRDQLRSWSFCRECRGRDDPNRGDQTMLPVRSGYHMPFCPAVWHIAPGTAGPSVRMNRREEEQWTEKIPNGCIAAAAARSSAWGGFAGSNCVDLSYQEQILSAPLREGCAEGQKEGSSCGLGAGAVCVVCCSFAGFLREAEISVAAVSADNKTNLLAKPQPF